MLVMSQADEGELERWRSIFGKCQLPRDRMRPQPKLDEAIAKLPNVMALLMRTRVKAGAWLGPVCLAAEDIADIEQGTKISRREMMAMLLDVASALAQSPGDGNHVGAVVEGGTGAMYVGAPLVWQGGDIKFTVHGVQAAILNAWHHDETKIKNLMVETQPCTCCRQFIREVAHCDTIKILLASDGPNSIETGNVAEIELNPKGLKLTGIRGRLMGENRSKAREKPETNELFKLASQAALLSYAPYSRNFAGVSIKTKHGTVHQGRYAEVGNSIAGLLAVEVALVNLVMTGEKITDVKNILLVETRGTVTQFSATQQLATAMGNVPFRFKMTG